MKHPNVNYRAVLAAAREGAFCDSGHYMCPFVEETGVVRFPSGGIVRPNNSFSGPERLLETIRRILSYAGGSAGCASPPLDCPCPAREYWSIEGIDAPAR